MTLEEAKIKFSMIKNEYSIRNYFHTDMSHQERALIGFENLVIELIEDRQELIDYLKEKINECNLIGNDEDYIKTDVYEEILSKIEKR